MNMLHQGCQENQVQQDAACDPTRLFYQVHSHKSKSTLRLVQFLRRLYVLELSGGGKAVMAQTP
jgi:hypothetical protein